MAIIAHTFNPSTGEAETGGSLWVQGQSWLYSKPLSQQQQSKPNKRVMLLETNLTTSELNALQKESFDSADWQTARIPSHLGRPHTASFVFLSLSLEHPQPSSDMKSEMWPSPLFLTGDFSRGDSLDRKGTKRQKKRVLLVGLLKYRWLKGTLITRGWKKEGQEFKVIFSYRVSSEATLGYMRPYLHLSLPSKTSLLAKHCWGLPSRSFFLFGSFCLPL